jgi:four helix bundle protein
MKENIIQQKSFDFAVNIVRLFQGLVKDHKEYVLSKQILRSGTSVGANIEEAIGGISKRDFIAKLQISYKECRETLYWIKLLKATGYIENEMSGKLKNDAEEIIRIIVAILKSSKAGIK